MFDFSLQKLYDELHVSEHQIQKERKLNEKLEELNVKLGPLEKVDFVILFFIIIDL